MEVPNFLNSKPVDEEGNWTPEWANVMNQLFNQLQTYQSNEGNKLPQLETANIALLTDADKSMGSMVYDSDTNEMKVNINGTWRVVTVV